MKTIRVLATAALLVAAVAFTAGADAPALGQPGSLVEVYGLIDTGLRLSTNADAAGEAYFGFSQGLFNGSRFGSGEPRTWAVSKPFTPSRAA